MRLEELAQEGRARARAAAAEEAMRQRAAARAERREVLRLGRGYLLDALVERPRGSPVLTLARTVRATVACGAVWGLGELLGLPLVAGAGLVGVIVLPFAWFGVRRWSGARILRAERAWLHDLPFPVFGYFAALCATPEEECTVRVKVWTRGEGPSDEVMEGIVGRAGGATSVTRMAGGWQIESGILHSPAMADMDPTHGAKLAWMRALIQESLIPLHQVHPLKRVQFVS
jgi:hypothetical protein